MSQIVVPAQRPPVLPYVGRHRWPTALVPSNPPARDFAELEGRTRDLGVASARAVWGYVR